MIEDTARILTVLKLAVGVLPLLAREEAAPPPSDDDAAVVLLLSERRRRLVQLVQEEPGITILQAEYRLRMGAGVFFHHLGKLIAAGFIEKQKLGKEVHLYPGGRAPPADRTPLANEVARELARAIIATPGLSSEQLAERTGRNIGVARAHLRNLLDARLIIQEKRGRTPIYRPTPAVIDEMRTRN